MRYLPGKRISVVVHDLDSTKGLGSLGNDADFAYPSKQFSANLLHQTEYLTVYTMCAGPRAMLQNVFPNEEYRAH